MSFVHDTWTYLHGQYDFLFPFLFLVFFLFLKLARAVCVFNFYFIGRWYLISIVQFWFIYILYYIYYIVMVYFIVWFISFGSSSRFVTTFIFFFWIDYTRKKTTKKKNNLWNPNLIGTCVRVMLRLHDWTLYTYNIWYYKLLYSISLGFGFCITFD